MSTVKTVANGNMSPESFNSDSHSISSIQSETYIGPPPPLPHKPLPPLQQKPPHLAKATPHFNKIPVFRNKPMFLQNKPPQHILSALPPHQLIGNQMHPSPAHANQALHPNQVQHSNHVQHQNHVQHPNQVQHQNQIPKIPNQVHPNQVHLNQIHLNQVHPNPMHPNQVHFNRIRGHPGQHINKDQPPNRLVPQPVRPNVIPLNHVLPTPNIGAPPNQNDMHKYVLNNVAGGVNDIIEIQRIPEVYSTDLPPVHIYHAPQEIVSFTAETIEPTRTSNRPQDIQTINRFPEVVESATGQPLFVNIQPSQIAKVLFFFCLNFLV